MGKKQCDCVRCGAPVGIIGRTLCCRCTAKEQVRATQSACPGCGADRVLQADTGRCTRCSRQCVRCGGPLRFIGSTLCRHCRRADQDEQRRATREPCGRCGRLGYLRTDTGWCGTCSRPHSKKPLRTCRECGGLTDHLASGMCSACWQRHPDRPFIRLNYVSSRLEDPPTWLGDFVAHLAARHSPGRCSELVTALGRLLADDRSNHPQAVLERARRPGRSMGTLARGLEDFFTERGLALPTAHADGLAAGRRQSRVDAAPLPLRPAVDQYAQSLVRARERARRAGTRPRSDSTLESALAAVRDFALFLVTERRKQDWAVVDVSDVEAFLAVKPGMRRRHLTVLRQFFVVARRNRITLVDPTRGLTARSGRGFSGRTITIDQQRALFRRWSANPDVHPHEALLGLLALLHGVSSRELRLLRLDEIDPAIRSVRLGQRQHPVPLDPVSWTALERCLAHREQLRTGNPHVVVTRGTKALRTPASVAYFSHILDQAGVAAHRLRVTRLADLVNTMDPKLVASVFGMRPEGVLIYLADHVDNGRLTPTRAASAVT